MKRILAISRKEIYHILRDPRSLIVSVLMPIGMLLLFGYAIDMELKELPIAILDMDKSTSSHDFVRSMTSSEFFIETHRLNSRKEIEPGFRQRKFRAAIVIPVNFEKELQNNPESKIQVLIDGADASTASAAYNYIMSVIMQKNAELAFARSSTSKPVIEPKPRVFFNPELISARFIVPGLVAVVMMMICSLLTSITVAREKETGTLEQVLTSPVRAYQVIIGKVIPYVGIAAIDAILILFLGYYLFQVPMMGNWFVLAAYSLIYIIIALALGLLISAVTQTQQVAMMLALVATLLPTLLLSGFIFAHSSMPTWLQLIAKIIPATYYLKIIRGIMLVGRSWFPLEGGIMLLMMVLLLLIATKKFKSRLE